MYHLLLLCWSTILLSTRAQNSFFNPPGGGPIHQYGEDPLYEYGTIKNLRWSTSFHEYTLWLYQNDNPNAEEIVGSMTTTNEYTWLVETTLPYQKQPVFFFLIADDNNPDSQFSSHYFNITPPASGNTAPSATAVQTNRPDAADMNTNTGTLPQVTSATNNTSSGSTSGLSTGAKAGIGVGVAIGGLLIIGLAVAVFLLYRSKKRNPSKGAGNDAAPPPFDEKRANLPQDQGDGFGAGYYGPQETGGTSVQQPGVFSKHGQYSPVPRHEMGEDSRPVELGTQKEQEPVELPGSKGRTG